MPPGSNSVVVGKGVKTDGKEYINFLVDQREVENGKNIWWTMG